jgi:hypothetical protein
VRLLGGELAIDVCGDSMTMRGPAEYVRPFVLEWPDPKVMTDREERYLSSRVAASAPRSSSRFRHPERP